MEFVNYATQFAVSAANLYEVSGCDLTLDCACDQLLARAVTGSTSSVHVYFCSRHLTLLSIILNLFSHPLRILK